MAGVRNRMLGDVTVFSNEVLSYMKMLWDAAGLFFPVL